MSRTVGAGLRGHRHEHAVGAGRGGLHRHSGVGLGVAVSGGYAYVADGIDGLRVIDVSTPSAPVEVGVLDTSGIADRMSRSRAATRTSYGLAPRSRDPAGDRREHAVGTGGVGLRRKASGPVSRCRADTCSSQPATPACTSSVSVVRLRSRESSSRRRRWRPGPRAPSSRPTSRSTTPGRRRPRFTSSGCRAARTTPSPSSPTRSRSLPARARATRTSSLSSSASARTRLARSRWWRAPSR